LSTNSIENHKNIAVSEDPQTNHLNKKIPEALLKTRLLDITTILFSNNPDKTEEEIITAAKWWLDSVNTAKKDFPLLDKYTFYLHDTKEIMLAPYLHAIDEWKKKWLGE
jgi:hypothetical protein